MKERAEIGDWVQIEEVVLEAGDRAPGVPDDTAEVPLLMRIKGFAQTEADVGEQVKIKTIIGREVKGKLVDTDPRYDHDFGRPVSELLEVGQRARKMLRTTEKREVSDDGC